MAESILSVEGVTVQFGGLVALGDVDLAVATSGITGLIGPNGAGKTTLFNVITGLQRPVDGTVRFDGHDIGGWSPNRRGRAGIARTFQRLELFGGMSVRDNLLAAAEAATPGGVLGRGASARRALVDDVLSRLDLIAVADRRAGDLPTGLGRIVELGRAMSTQPRLLLLDEPSSGLDERETAMFRELLLEMTAGSGAAPAVLMVEHDVRLVMQVCREITVLDFGRRIACGTPDQIQRDPAVIAAYLGETAA